LKAARKQMPVDHRNNTCFSSKRLLGKSLLPLYLVLLLIFFFFLSCEAVWSNRAKISDIVITNNQDSLLVYFNTLGCFSPGMKKAILNGTGITFTFLIELYKPCSFRPNNPLRSLKLYHTIKYDSLREEFDVTLSEWGNQVFLWKDFSKSQEMMADVSNVPLIPLKVLGKNNHYQLRIKAELNKVRLPLYIRYIMFLVSLWDFETDWNVVDFTY
jgi:hypothetical protein